MSKSCIGIGVLCLLATLARADELRFKNGDRLSGTVVSMAEGKLVFTSVVAGKITVPMGDLETFSTDGPVAIVLDDGTSIRQSVSGSSAGQFATKGDGAVAGQDFVLARVTKINPEPEAWHGAFAGGAQFRRGDSVTDGAHADLAARRRGEDDRTTFAAGYIGERQQDEDVVPKTSTTTERKLFGNLQYDLFFTKKLYGYTRVGAERDGVAEVDLRFLGGVGAGWQVWEEKKRSLSFESGVTWVSENFSDETEDETFLALREAWNYDQELVSWLRFFHSGEWFPGLEVGTGHLVKTSTGLRSPLTDTVFLEAKMLWDWDSEPAEDAKKRNATYLFSVGYGF